VANRDNQRDALLDESSVEGLTRAAQIASIIQFAPLTFVVNLINAALMVYVVAPVASVPALSLWLSAVAIIAFFGARAWFKARRRAGRRAASHRAIRRATVNAAVLALSWAVVPAVWFPHVEPYGQLVIATVITGMICAGGFALSTVKPAAYTYVIILTAGANVGLLGSPLPYQAVLLALLTAYGTVVLISVSGHAKLFAAHFLAEATLTERGQVIELLLAEFEENGSDWLFQTDRQRRIVHCSQRFLAVAGATEENVTGVALEEFLSSESRMRLLAAMQTDEPFRELVVEASTGSAVAWWSLTAKPILNDRQQCVGWRGVGSDITAAKAARDHVEWMAKTDVLTGVANRASFLSEVEACIAHAGNGQEPAVLCALDVDHFKTINDTLGHPVGDALLKVVSERLLEFSGDVVRVGRLGGDEFAILFCRPDPGLDRAELVAPIFKRLTSTHVIDGLSVPVRLSMGVASCNSSDETSDSLMGKADLALYRAKQEGRGRIAVYDESMHREVQAQRVLRDEMGEALKNGQFEIHYQPILDLKTRRTVCCEALVRWRHPERGLIAPSAFIPLAETTGHIGEIGRWVLRHAIEEAAKWPKSVRVAVNVSPAQIGPAALLLDIVAALSSNGLDPSRLELEITEAIFLRDEMGAIGFIEQIKALGVRLALDDFGTGFSSLGYVARYPIDKIKIDRSFISGTAPIKNREAIVASIVRLAKDLNLTTTAEGVEREEEVEWISQLGCEQAQGYLFAKPMRPHELREFIAREHLDTARAVA